MPHKGLAGESPWDYLWRGHRQRPVGQPSPYNESNPYYSVEGGLYIMSPQAEEDLAHTLDTLRTLADWCGEIDSFKRAVLSEDVMKTFGGKVGDMVLKFVAVREHALEPLYQGHLLRCTRPGSLSLMLLGRMRIESMQGSYRKDTMWWKRFGGTGMVRFW